MQWGVESIAALAASQEVLRPLAASEPFGGAAGSQFAQLMTNGLVELNASVGAAESAMRQLAAGQQVELHDVMISLERARLSVQTFVQVRNKLIESYQDLMRMQL